MKVLIVHPCKGFYGGAEEVVVQLHKYLLEHGIFCKVVLKDAPKQVADKLYSHGILTGVDNEGTYGDFLLSAQRLLKWADVVNVHNFPATLTTFPKKIPTVYMCNEPAELFTNWKRKPIEAFNRWWVKKSGMKVVVADKMNAHRFFKIYGVEPKVIPYGIDYDFWSQGHEVLGKEDGFTILQVGTITPYKNQLESIKVLEEIRDAKLLLVGSKQDKKYTDELFNYILTHKLVGRVEFIDHMSHEELRDLYKSCDILLHPIRGQGGWLVPFEAICAGLPVIATTDFSASEYLYRIGMPVARPDEITPVVKTVLENYGNFKGVGREWIKENLTWEKFGEGMVKVFEEAIYGNIR